MSTKDKRKNVNLIKSQELYEKVFISGIAATNMKNRFRCRVCISVIVQPVHVL